jgi:hypothetical protein
MKKSRIQLVLIVFSILLVVYGCDKLNDKGITSVDENISDAYISSENNSIFNDELAKMDASGMVIEDADAVFSIGWKPFFNPVDSQMEQHSHAFAVAPNTDTTMNPHFRSGNDMGTVNLKYEGTTQELNKIEKQRGGIFYALGKGKPGKKGGRRELDNETEIVEIPFIPGATYSFEATGADDFSPVTVDVVAPDNLVQISAPAVGELLNPENDIVVSWSGGEQNQDLMVVLKPVFERKGIRGQQEERGSHGGGQKGGRGNGGQGGPPEGPGQGSQGMEGPRGGEQGEGPRPEESDGGPGLKHHMFDEFALRYLVEDNTGTFTVPAADIQAVLSEVETDGFRLEIMQMITTETDIENSKYIAQLRTSDMMVVKFQ